MISKEEQRVIDAARQIRDWACEIGDDHYEVSPTLWRELVTAIDLLDEVNSQQRMGD